MKASANDYFVRESLEYVDRLTTLLDGDAVLDAGAVLRLVAAVRGCTRMAGADRLAGLTEQLEACARAVQTGPDRWTTERRELALRTTRELGTLLRALESWGPDEERRLREITERWTMDSDRPVPVSDLFYDDDGPHIIANAGVEDGVVEGRGAVDDGIVDVGAAAKEAPPVVPVSELFFRGEGALHEALSLRPRIEAVLAADGNDGERAELLDELFDLIELGLTEPDGG